MKSAPMTRRRALRTVFCASAALSLNLHRRVLGAAAADDLHWLTIGDFGSMEPPQMAVANGMQSYISRLGLKAPGLLLLGDNFYKKMEGGLKSERWKTGFEDIYPAAVFPGPVPVVLGNHDYHDNAGGEQTQLAYARLPGARWTLPDKWYRLDFPAANPLVTFLFLDTNHRLISGADENTGKPKNSLTAEEEAAQWKWLKAELEKPRAPWTVCVGHHPVYSNGKHGDTKALVKELAPLLEQYRVPIYLCGHDHDLQHLELENRKTSFVVSGGGGARVRDLKQTERGRFGQPVYGFTHLQAGPQRLIFRHVDANGKQLHAFEKHADGTFKVHEG